MQPEIDEELASVIQEATKKALDKLFYMHDERFYYCSLITTGEGTAFFLCVSGKEDQ